MPLKFINAEKLIQLIQSEFSTEINYFAAPDVAVTAHAVGIADLENWTQELFENKIITSLPPKEKGDRFVEVERTLTGLYCLILQNVPFEDAYHAFTAAQRNISEIKPEEILKEETFKKIYDHINLIVNNQDKFDILKRLIIYSDLGKSPHFKATIKQLADEKKIVIDLSRDPDDLICEILVKFNDEQLEKILPSFSRLSQNARKVLKEIYPIMQACFGHIYFLDGGEKTLKTISDALNNISPEKRTEALDLVYLAQFYDGVGAQGQRKITGSLTCTENFYQGYSLIYQALCELKTQLNAEGNVAHAANIAFNYYLNKRAKLLGFEASLSPEQQFLTRIGCMLRGFTPEFGQLLIKEFEKLLPEQKRLLVMQLGFGERGLESWTKAHYVTTIPLNVSRVLFEKGNISEAIAQAIKSVICFAMLIEEMKKRYPSLVTDKKRAISFGEIAFLAAKSPELFNPQKFNPNEYILEQENNKIVRRTDKEIDARKENPPQQNLSYEDSATLRYFKLTPALNAVSSIEITSIPTITHQNELKH